MKPVFPDQDEDTTGIQNTQTTRSIAENTPSGSIIGEVVVASDTVNITAAGNLDTTTATTTADDLLTYTLEGPNASSFDINRVTGQLMTKAALDYEKKSSYSVKVKATDPSGGNSSASINVTINVVPVAEGPEITGGATTIRVDENTPASTVLSNYTATDDEDDKAKTALEWSLDDTSDDIFSIEGGQLKFKESPNFEALTTAEYPPVTVTVNDSDTTTDPATETVIVTVIDVEEEGSIEAVIDVAGVESEVQRPRSGTEITAKLTDPDWATTSDTDEEITASDTAAELAWQWATSTSATGPWNDIDSATTDTYRPSDSDVGSYLRVTATYVDGTTDDDTTTPDVDERKDKVHKAFSVTVLPSTENKPPAFPVQNPDAADAAGKTAQERRVSENAKVGDLVGAPVVATDIRPDGRQDRLVYSLEDLDENADDDGVDRVDGDDGPEVEGDTSFFKIDSATGQISVKKEGLDYEATDPADADNNPGDKTYNVLVRATDTSMASSTAKVEIKIVDVREAPKMVDEIGNTTVQNLSATTTVEHDSDSTVTATTTVLSTYAATDDEDDNATTPVLREWSVEGADKDMFALCEEDDDSADTCSDPNDPVTTGRNNIVSLRFKDNPNFEAHADSGGNNVYNVMVVATDSDRQTASHSVAVTLANVEEDGDVTLSNRQPEVGVPITASLTDADGGDPGHNLAVVPSRTRNPDPCFAYLSVPEPESADLARNPERQVAELHASCQPITLRAPTDSACIRWQPTLTATGLRIDPGTTEDESQEKDMATGTSAFAVQPKDDNNQIPVFPNQNAAMTIRISESTAEGAPLGGETPVLVEAQDDDANLTYTLGRYSRWLLHNRYY